MFRFGIEHEVAFLRPDGRFADFTNTTFDELDALVARLPEYPADYPGLRVGDLGIKRKRWYIEGYERYDTNGAFTVCVPKGIEIRTTIHPSIAGAVGELRQSFEALESIAAPAGFRPAWISYNPIAAGFTPDPPLNAWEAARRASSPEKQTAEIPMMTHGPDLNLSVDGWSAEQAIDLGRKLTAYSPYLTPFTFSSPFLEGTLWDGYSVRTFRRTGARPAALVFVADQAKQIKSQPSLTKPARIPAEDGRVELKSIDNCADFTLYGGLLALMKGLALDETLGERLTVPDAALHQRSALRAFEDDQIAAGGAAVLEAARAALRGDPDRALLEPLERMLAERRTPAHLLIESYRRTGSIEATLAESYALARSYRHQG